MNLRNKLLAVGIAAGLVLTPVASTALASQSHAGPVVSQVQNQDAATRAADWLNSQFVDSTYLTGFTGEGDPSNTADAVLALVASQAHPETITKAVEWLQSQAPTAATNAGNSARFLLVADAMGIDPTDFGGVDLVSKVADDGSSQAGNPYGLALQVLALSRSGATVPDGIVNALSATQEASGAFAFPSGIDIDSTGLAALALSLLTEDPDAQDAADAAVQWLLDNQCTTVVGQCTSVGAYWGSYSPANTSGLVIPALATAGYDETDEVAWLLTQQTGDGGFAYNGASDIYATSQALIAITGSSLATVEMFEYTEPTQTPVPTSVAPTPVPEETTPTTSASSTSPAPTASADKPQKLPQTGSDGSGMIGLALITLAAGVVAASRIRK
ncbi:hypothetical protein GCM10009785_11010 [Brooklawnia cerclae]|uniref:LPXTG-motif cell wall-anchored protein n=1 Tax=Brooklawnia cerclae TaxID=349934 RepID=A0ABX0SJV3_9ACTN|nr:hypothetical protein [Brooklawnia cerclae]NIH58670.1 LPXTG-motif cell wall-anchored protein [Brooklawnia cerclae]